MSGNQLTFDATPEELTLFLSEGEEQLEILSQDILRLENEGDANTDLVQEIFRAAHTLKGSSGAIGHQRMARLTHATENVLDQVRHHTLPVTKILIDLLLNSLDALRVLLDEVSTGIESDTAIDHLCVDLTALANGKVDTAPAPATPQAAAVKASPAPPSPSIPQMVSEADLMSELNVHRIEVAIDPGCPMPAARALQIILACGAVGVILRSEPEQEAIESSPLDTGRHIVVWAQLDAADAVAKLQQRLHRIPEVQLIALETTADVPTTTEVPELAAGSTKETIQGDSRQWHVAAAFDSRCALPSARALQVMLACQHLGDIIRCEPDESIIDSGQVDASTGINVWFASNHATEASIRQSLARINEIDIQSIEQTTTDKAKTPLTPPVVEAPIATPIPAAATATPRPAPGEAAENESAKTATAGQAPRMVRIDVERLDALMNLIGELVISRTRLARVGQKLGQRVDDPILVEELTETSQHIARISDDLQDHVMRSRMLPIESVFSKFPRLMRDLAKKVDKKIDFIVEGKDTELDRSVAEQISDPIIHLLRNSIDHGIESEELRRQNGKSEVGQIRLAARHEENQIVIDVEDDGQGIRAEVLKQKAVSKEIITPEIAARMSDREAVELIFASGFSTAANVSDISGRGVGMDIVRTNVERLNGSVNVETEPGQGTRFTIRLPLTLAIIRALLIEVAGQPYAIPLTSVVEALRIDQEEIRSISGHEAIELRGQVLPLLRLADVFRDITAPGGRQHFKTERGDRHFVVAVKWGERRGGLIVDSLIGEQEIVIKPLGLLFRGAHGISGGAVLGDGQVAPILDVAALIKQVINLDASNSAAKEARL